MAGNFFADLAPATGPQRSPGVIMGPAKSTDPLDVSRDIRDETRLTIARTGEARDQRREVRDIDRTQFDQTAKLRDDYDNSVAVKRYKSSLDVYASGLKTSPTPEGDRALITSFAKLSDPTTGVLQGEADSVEQSSPAVERIIANMSNQLDASGLFSDRARASLRRQMASLMAERNKAFIGERVRFKKDADAFGIDPMRVVGEHPGGKFQQLEADTFGAPVSQLDYEGEDVIGRTLPSAPAQTQGGGQPDGEGPKGYRFDDSAVGALNAYLKTPGASPEGLKAMHDQMSGGQALMQPQQAAAIFKEGRLDGFDYGKIDEGARARAQALMERQDAIGIQKGDGAQLVNSGMTFGLNDEAAGVGGSLAGILRGDLNVADNYTVNRDAERLRTQGARDRMGYGGAALEVGGGFLTGAPVRNALAVAVPNGLLATTRATAKSGAQMGALAGYGYGDGAQGSATNALLGAGVGGAIGGAIPIAGRLVSNRVQGARRMVGADPELPRSIVGRAIDADGNTPQAVGAMMDDAATRGSPLSLADTGDNTRALLASVGRQPGGSRTLTRDAVVGRQAGQQERLSAAVIRDLGPTANIREMGEELITRAKAQAGPLYDKAYAASGASSVKLDDLFVRPSMKKGLSNAHKLAQEEGIDPTVLGFDLDQAGEVVLTRVPSFKTLDYIKRGIDDVVEKYRDGTTGKLNLDGEGRAVNNTLRQFIARVDKVNPDYAAARAAYAGPARLRSAMDKGAKALSRSPDDLAAEIKVFSPTELESYQLGLRKAITDTLESKGDYADKVNTLIGTPKKRAALRRAFGNRDGFDNFMATLGDERAMAQTYQSVAGNSATAERLAQDATTNDGGLVEDALGSAIRAGRQGGVTGALFDAVEQLRGVSSFGAGQAGQRTRESVAALLTETDPAVLKDIIRAAQQARARQLKGQGRQYRVTDQTSRIVGRSVGNALAPPTEQQVR